MIYEYVFIDYNNSNKVSIKSLHDNCMDVVLNVFYKIINFLKVYLLFLFFTWRLKIN